MADKDESSSDAVTIDTNPGNLFAHPPSGYTVIEVRLPGHSRFVPLNVHRLRYMIHTRCIQLNPKNYHVSHLCHTKPYLSYIHDKFSNILEKFP
jgi:hypothetical protein